jgi:hypothetical protein
MTRRLRYPLWRRLCYVHVHVHLDAPKRPGIPVEVPRFGRRIREFVVPAWFIRQYFPTKPEE